MGWQWGSIPVVMYHTGGSSPVIGNFLLMSDSTPLLMTDMTGMFLAGT